MPAVFFHAAFLVATTIAGRSELEIVGLAALIAMMCHFFVSLVWPGIRAVLRTVWSDGISAVRRMKTDIHSLLK